MEMAVKAMMGFVFWFFAIAFVISLFSDFGDWKAKRRRVRIRVSKDDFAFAEKAAAAAGFTRTEEYFAVLLKKALRAERH